MAVQILNILKNSIADKSKIKSGDVLLKINGSEINDVLDYMFYLSEQVLTLEIKRADETFSIIIKKSEYDDIGLEFRTYLMDEKQSCKNKCVFCFIDQMPPNMRETLYFKDDDERLSFLHGNYITLTNLSDKDVERIIKMRLNINVSVHTTNPELRNKMMNNRFAGEKLKYLKMMADAGIMMNCQIVLCPGLNDGDELTRSLDDLAKLSPSIQSIAVVPVGLTKFRENLYNLQPFNKESAQNAIQIIEERQKQFLQEHGTRLVYPADEFYLKAEREIPNSEFYEEYPQYENGVGLIRALVDEFDDALSQVNYNIQPRNISIATGYAAYNVLCELIKKVRKKWHNINCNVYDIRNNFFGENITVAGLITGQDLLLQLKDKNLGDELLIPSAMLKQNSNLFLDDYTVDELEKELNVKISAVENDGYILFNKILGK